MSIIFLEFTNTHICCCLWYIVEKYIMWIVHH